MRRETRLYLLGPITYSKNPFAEFKNAQIALEKAGFEVINPIELNPEHYFKLLPGVTIGEKHQLRVDLSEMLLCDGVAMLPITCPSSGSAREMNLAFDLDIPVKTVEDWLIAENGRRPA